MKNVLWFMLLILACSAEKSPIPTFDYWKDFVVFEPEYDASSLPLTQDFQGKKTNIAKKKSIKEASGLVVSTRNKGMAWVHNDSGNDPELILVDLNTGEELCRFLDSSLQNVDWEDISAYIDKEGISWLIIGDIGDNLQIKRNIRLVYIPEPVYLPSMKGSIQRVNLNAKLRFVVYPKGSHDAEALFVDPNRGDVYIVTKRDARSAVYALPYKEDFTQWDTAIYCGSFPFNLVTGADLSNHRQLAIRTYLDLFYWEWEPGSDIRSVLALPPKKLPYDQSEPQGESIGFAEDGRSYFLLSEELFGIPAILYRWD